MIMIMLSRNIYIQCVVFFFKNHLETANDYYYCLYFVLTSTGVKFQVFRKIPHMYHDWKNVIHKLEVCRYIFFDKEKQIANTHLSYV